MKRVFQLKDENGNPLGGYTFAGSDENVLNSFIAKKMEGSKDIWEEITSEAQIEFKG